MIIYDGESSTVFRDGDIVTKVYKDQWRHLGDFEREVVWVQRMPYYIGHDRTARSIVMRDCGNPVQKGGLPIDWEEQFARIMGDLVTHGCQHNDIRPENILIKGYELTLIDYQWATAEGHPPPRQWPKRLGGEWRAFGVDQWEFDDYTSFRRSLESLA